MIPHSFFSSPGAAATAPGHQTPDTPPSGPRDRHFGPGRRLASLPLPQPTAPATAATAAWRDVDRWRMSLRDALHGRGALPGREPRLHTSDAVAIRAALNTVPAAVLLPGEDGVCRAASAALRLTLLDRLRRDHALSPAQSRLVLDALELGDACMRCGPIDQRRPRSADEMSALQAVTTWAGTGPGDRQRAGLVTAVRKPVYRDGVAVVRWREPSSDTTLTPLALPPGAVLARLLRWDGTFPRLELSTHTLRADASVDAESALFSWRTLKPQRLPHPADLRRLPTHVEGLDLEDLKPDLQWPDIAPLLDRLPGLLRIDVGHEQLLAPAPAGWRLEVDQGHARFMRVGAAAGGGEDLPYLSFSQFSQKLEGQLRTLDLNGSLPTARDDLHRLKRLQRHMTEQPMPTHEVLAILQRETGTCVDANVMRLDELELLAQLAGRPSVPAAALLALRHALTRRAHQTSAQIHTTDPENLEVGAGLAWAVDRRLATLLDLDVGVSRPHHAGLARLPGVVPNTGPVNDQAAADALIAAEVAEGFPTLAHLLCWQRPLADPVATMLDRDADFQLTRAGIEASFQRDYQAAVEHSDAPLAGSDAFQRKEEALQQARLDHLVRALQPALLRLRGGGVLPAFTAFAAPSAFSTSSTPASSAAIDGRKRR